MRRSFDGVFTAKDAKDAKDCTRVSFLWERPRDRSQEKGPARKAFASFAVALAVVVAAGLALAGCVPYPGQDGQGDAAPAAVDSPPGQFAGLDPGASDEQTLHFDVSGYGINETQQAADRAEAAYNRIMVDTNLYSFKPSGLYKIVIYGSPEEYRRKTGQPGWSGGVAVGNSIYTFAGPQLDMTVAHEMTHLIWYEYMGRLDPDQRWVNEGLAVYEEEKAAAEEGYRGDLYADINGLMRSQPIPMDQMIKLTPATERERTVSVWYAESVSMVRFMIERGGRIGFSQFLASLHDGLNFDAAVAAGFPGQWHSLNDFDQAWQRSLL